MPSPFWVIPALTNDTLVLLFDNAAKGDTVHGAPCPVQKHRHEAVTVLREKIGARKKKRSQNGVSRMSWQRYSLLYEVARL